MMSGACLSAEALADLVRGAGSDQVRRHVAQCQVCARRFEMLRRIGAVGARPIADTVAEVDLLVITLLAAPRAAWWKVVLETEYRRADVARRLLALAADARFRDRPLSISLAETATIIADRLADGGRVTANVRFDAWKLFSALLREAGRYGETETALVKAAAAAAATPDPELAQAGVLFARALVAAEPDVWHPEEAAFLLDRAEKIFMRRDVTRLYALRMARGMLQSRMGELHEARRTFQALLAVTPEEDRESYLNALANLTGVRVQSGERGPSLERVIALLIEENTSLGRTVSTARARWMMGVLLVGRGEHDAGIESLRAAMADIGDLDSAVRIGLEMLKVLPSAGREEEGPSLLNELASAVEALDEREPSRRRHAYTRTHPITSRSSPS